MLRSISTSLLVLGTALLGLTFAETTNHWAVLVTGSKGYTNYRHHSDVCHAYHIMKNNGIPED